jgi:O-antigen/teichoic acid export membrane protein
VPAIVRAIASNYAALAAQAALLLILTPYLIDRRGAAVFGGYALVVAISGYMRLLDLGLGPTIARFVARHRTEAQELSRIVAGGLAVSSLLAAVALLGAALVAVADPNARAGNEDLTLALVIGVAAGALQVPLRTFGHVLYGLDRLPLRNGYSVLRAVLVLGAIVASVEAGASLPEFVLAGAAAEVLISAAQAIHCLRTTPGLRPRPRYARLGEIRGLLRFSVGVLALSVSAQVSLYGNTIVLAAAIGTSAVAVYSVAARLVEGAALAMNQVSDVFMPALAKLDSRNEHERARGMVRKGVAVSFVLAVPLVGVLIGLGPALIESWVGSGFDDSATPLALLAAGIVLNAPIRFPVLWAIGAARHGAVSIVATVEAIAAILLGVALVGPLEVDGVALATAVTVAVSNGLVVPWLLLRDLQLPAWSTFYRPLLLSALLTGPLVVVTRLTVDAPVGDSPLLTVAAALAWYAALAVALSFVVLESDQRKRLRSALERRRRGD